MVGGKEKMEAQGCRCVRGGREEKMKAQGMGVSEGWEGRRRWRHRGCRCVRGGREGGDGGKGDAGV